MTEAPRPSSSVASVLRRGVLRVLGGLLLGALALAGPVSPAGASPEDDLGAQVARAVERAKTLRQEERRTAVPLPRALADVEAAAADSGVALAAYRVAVEARQEAVVELNRQEVALAAAEADVVRQRAETARWVRSVYVDGGTWGTSSLASTLLAGGTTDDVATRQTVLERSRTRRETVEARAREVAVARERTMVAAGRAGEAVVAAERRAEAAREARETVLAAHRRRLADLRVAQEASRRLAVAAEAEAVRLAADHLAAAGVAAGLPSGGGNSVVGPVGPCGGGDVAAFGNGRIPLSVLCPLGGPSGGVEGEYLRADAAYAFGRMGVAFAARFGRGLCVADAYRSFEEQVRIRRAAVRVGREAFTAVPGRSKHGWGTAVDLCGGVERFTSAEHVWMTVNAPLFGWFHPVWAREGGGVPEPWHWEFSG
ncbi:MAG: peptidoglycan DL-endopeptidase CwlO [Actinomycetota bacterium]|nr:peptidoglycan DL-endopeptidase CwlO [Actinomycetota bacterium]